MKKLDNGFYEFEYRGYNVKLLKIKKCWTCHVMKDDVYSLRCGAKEKKSAETLACNFIDKRLKKS